MDTTKIEIPTELMTAAKLTEEEAKTELALWLYRKHRLTLEQAKEMAGANGAEVMEKLWAGEETFNTDEFLSWASHDLKTPLNAVIGFSKLVLKGIDGPVNEMQTTDLTSVHLGGQRMLILLSNLVDVARINIKETKLSITDGDFEQLITDSAKRWKTQNPEKELTVEANLLSPQTRFDAPRLRQAIMGFLSFASLIIAKGTITLSAQDDASGFNITIQSVGEIARDKSVMDTTMLGYISKSLVALHDGHVEMMQEMEDGMMIIFSIPRQDPAGE